MRVSNWWLLIIVAVFGAAGIWGWLWLGEDEEYAAIDIMAPREPDLGLPVYAQFSVTQLLALPQPVVITKVRVPIYISAAGQLLTIQLRQADSVIQRWRLRPAVTGTQVIELSLDQPTWRSGAVALFFDGGQITHQASRQAPRLFTESADDAYLGGHYRIADNDKHGDIGLQVLAERARRERLRQQAEQNPIWLVERLSLLLASLLLVSIVPPTLLGRWARTTPNTT